MIPTGESTLFSTLERTQYLRVGTTRERTHTSAHLPQNPPKNRKITKTQKKSRSTIHACRTRLAVHFHIEHTQIAGWMDG